MSIPTSAVAVCNLALDLIREKPISDITDPQTTIEALCARWYDVTRQALLQSHNWNFATVSASISRGGTPDDPLYEDYYSFPNDYLKLLALGSSRYSLNRYDYKLGDKKILINNGGVSSLVVWYITDLQTVSHFPPLFTMYLVGELALVLAYKVSAKPAVLADVKAHIDKYKQQALAANGQERPPVRYESSRMVNAGRNMSSYNQVAGGADLDTLPE